MDDLQLISEENDASGIGIVQADLCFIGEHSSDYSKPLTNKKKIVLCLYLLKIKVKNAVPAEETLIKIIYERKAYGRTNWCDHHEGQPFDPDRS